MNISYLILAHNNFKHLDRLIGALDDEYADAFYIHLDRKVTQGYHITNKKVTIIPDRYNINWGGFKMVEATIALMKNALKNSPDADYYILISGVDYPIRSKEYLQDLLSKQKEYIDVAPLPFPHKPLERYEYYYFEYDRRNIKMWNPLFLMEVFMKKLKMKRKIPFKIYVGGQWFALSKACIEYILEIIETDKRYVNFFRHSLIPDEAFFQTIIGNSLFADKVATDIVYTDWSVPVPPAIIEERHIEFLKETKGYQTEFGYCQPYFARKFNDDSASIVEKVEKELRS